MQNPFLSNRKNTNLITRDVVLTLDALLTWSKFGRVRYKPTYFLQSLIFLKPFKACYNLINFSNYKLKDLNGYNQHKLQRIFNRKVKIFQFTRSLSLPILCSLTNCEQVQRKSHFLSKRPPHQNNPKTLHMNNKKPQIDMTRE